MGKEIKIGDYVMLCTTVEDLPIEYGAEGFVKDQDDEDFLVDFGEKGSFFVKYCDLRITKPFAEMNDRERLKYEYREWVDKVSDECDWKTHFSIEEIQEKYSEIALKYALKIIDECLELNSDQKLVMLVNKKAEIKQLL
jgi:hypothetical protein